MLAESLDRPDQAALIAVCFMVVLWLAVECVEWVAERMK